jgi:hypothetical protein
MITVFIDIETIPDQSPDAITCIQNEIVVKAPNITKPNLITELGLGDQGKDKTIPELKELWLERFSEEAKKGQATEEWLKTSFDGSKGEICCIGIGTNLDNVECFTGDEQSILNSLNAWIDRLKRPAGTMLQIEFAAHNKSFDLPFVHKRLIINKINPLFLFKPHSRHRAGSFCTMEEWAGFGGKVSLDKLCGYLGIKGKLEGMDGSKVWPEYQAGNINKIAEYCADDVRCLIEVYNRLIFK